MTYAKITLHIVLFILEAVVEIKWCEDGFEYKSMKSVS